MDYRIEQLSPENIHHLVPLYKAAFKQSMSLPHLIKKYDTISFGASFIGFIAFTPQSMAAAYYGVIPCHCWVEGKTILAAQSADTMTHPHHRRKGLFEKLAKKTYMLATAQQVRLIFGFPNQKSFPGLVKLNWVFTSEPLQVFVLKTGGIPYAKILTRSPMLRRLYHASINSLIGDGMIKESFFEKPPDNSVKHDELFIKYKQYNASYVVTLDRVAAWIRVDGILKVGAVSGLHQENASQFLSRLRTLAAKAGCSEIMFMTSINSSLYQILKDSCSPSYTFPIGFLPLSNDKIHIDKICFEYCDVDTF